VDECVLFSINLDVVFILYFWENGLFIHIDAFLILCSSEESSFSSRVSARSSFWQSLPFSAIAASSLFCQPARSRAAVLELLF
jgi:hypothetical protein